MAGSLLGDEGPTLCRWARWRFATRSKTRSFLPDLPDGQITHFLSSPFRKNIPLSPSGKSALPARAIPFRKRGVGHRHERWDGMRWTRQCARRACQCVRRSRVVLTPRRWRQVLEELTLLGSDGDKKARSPRRARRKPLKPLRRECRIASAEPVCSCALFCAFLHTRPRVQRAPAIPCSLFFFGGSTSCKPRANRAARRRTCVCGLRWVCRLTKQLSSPGLTVVARSSRAKTRSYCFPACPFRALGPSHGPGFSAKRALKIAL